MKSILHDALGDLLEDFEIIDSRDEDIEKEIDWDTSIPLPTHGALLITLKNGKHLYFSTSEWASISRLKK